MKSKHFELVKKYYGGGSGPWSIEKVRKMVGTWITEAEYEEITGQPY